MQDIWGRNDTSTSTVGIFINPLPPPDPVINDGGADVVAPAGSAAQFNDSGTSCPGGGCTTYWDLSCPNERGAFTNVSGSSIAITIGRDDSFDVNAEGATDPFNCESSRCAFSWAADPMWLAARLKPLESGCTARARLLQRARSPQPSAPSKLWQPASFHAPGSATRTCRPCAAHLYQRCPHLPTTS